MNELKDELRFQKIPIRRFGTKPLEQSKDGTFWKKFKKRSANQVFFIRLRSLIILNQNGAVSWLDFCPAEPHQLAATSGTRVRILPVF